MVGLTERCGTLRSANIIRMTAAAAATAHVSARAHVSVSQSLTVTDSQSVSPSVSHDCHSASFRGGEGEVFGLVEHSGRETDGRAHVAECVAERDAVSAEGERARVQVQPEAHEVVRGET